MKKLIAMLPLFAVVLGMTAAVASQSSLVPASKEARLPNGSWVDITGQQIGVDYDCDQQTVICSESFDEDGHEIPSLRESGQYKDK